MRDSTNPESIPASLAAQLMRGTMWTIAMRWGVRLLGLISTVVLIRLLASEDFGLIAVAMGLVALVDQLSDFGIVWALVRDKSATSEDFDTAWTVRQVQMTAVASIAIATAPLAADFFQDPRLTAVLYVIGVSFLIRGFENIGVVEFQRKLEFHKDFAFRVSVKVVSVIITICFAIWLRSYWALAFGLLATNTLSVAFSYWFSAYRPRWTFRTWRKLWRFSQWILAQGIARYIFIQGPILMLGRITDASSVGYYSVANEVASLPATEVSVPVSRAVLPGFAQLIDDKSRLEQGFRKALSAVATVTLPVGLGIAYLAHDIVTLIMGPKWSPATILIQIFAGFATFRALGSLTGNLLVVLDEVKAYSRIMWIQALILIVGIVPAYRIANLEAVAALQAFASLIGLLLLFYVLIKTGTSSWSKLAKVFARPTVASLMMILSLTLLELVTPPSHEVSIVVGFFLMAIDILVAATVYASCVGLLWHLAGRPDSLEAMLCEHILRLLRVRGS